MSDASPIGTSEVPDWDSIFSQLAQTDWQIALALTGGGSGAIGKCISRAGASAHFVEAVVPYSRVSMIEYLGQEINVGSASSEAASLLAKTAFSRASSNSDRIAGGQTVPAAGLGLTAALPTGRTRRGDDRIHVCVQTLHWCWSKSVTLSPGIHTRASAEGVAESLVATGLAELIRRVSPD